MFIWVNSNKCYVEYPFVVFSNQVECFKSKNISCVRVFGITKNRMFNESYDPGQVWKVNFKIRLEVCLFSVNLFLNAEVRVTNIIVVYFRSQSDKTCPLTLNRTPSLSISYLIIPPFECELLFSIIRIESNRQYKHECKCYKQFHF